MSTLSRATFHRLFKCIAVIKGRGRGIGHVSGEVRQTFSLVFCLHLLWNVFQGTSSMPRMRSSKHIYGGCPYFYMLSIWEMLDLHVLNAICWQDLWAFDTEICTMSSFSKFAASLSSFSCDKICDRVTLASIFPSLELKTAGGHGAAQSAVIISIRT